MDDIIHLLPDSVANQIAAGEVVQRPSSIVKEMVENSIDAGADNIQVHIMDGGRSCVQVIDNGCGMSETDARMAFERHATSKIADAKDIYSLTTMGFRGEALASIAAVAQVEMKTRRPEDETGTFLRIDGAKMMEHKPVACPVGTNISVRNLFFNIPVRRKFLKKTQTEFNNILQDFERIALVYPEVKFLLTHNEVNVLNLNKETLKARISSVCGEKTSEGLLPVQTQTNLVNVMGFVGKPENSKRKGARQFFFVNGRFMKHSYFHTAVERAYDNIIPQGEHPNYFIYLQVDPQNIDVNVHPTKTEIKFENEQMIWQIINAVVREALGKFNELPTIDFNRRDDDINIPVMSKDGFNLRVTPPKTDYNPFKVGAGQRGENVPYEWERLYPDRKLETNENKEEIIVEGQLSRQVPIQTTLWGENEQDDGLDSAQVGQEGMFQFKAKYIVTVVKGKMTVIDQHRVHVAYLFSEFMEKLRNKKMVTQGLIFPEIIHLTKAEENYMVEIGDELKALGFDTTPLGGGAYSLNGVPSGMTGGDYPTLLKNLICVAMENKGAARTNVEEKIALAMAQSEAIPYGQRLNRGEMEELVKKWTEINSPNRSPDGKIICNHVDDGFIERLF